MSIIPKIFISSTIYDFKDLRSALKFYLNRMGYEVMASEANDFPVDRSSDSYTACLKNIQECQYFILLIGNRIGGMYDHEISITHKEYLVAKECANAGSLKIITFVRQSLWDHCERVKELAKYLRTTYRNDEEIQKISFLRSKFAHDAKKTFDFINEIKQSSEIKKCVIDKQERPLGNWIHVFDNFEDIISAINQEFCIRGITDKKYLYQLQYELFQNEEKLFATSQYEETFKNPDFHLKYLIDELRKLDLSNPLRCAPVKLEKDHLIICAITLRFKMMNRYSHHYLDRCIDSGMFLSYDLMAQDYQESDVYWVMKELSTAIFQFEIICEGVKKTVDSLLLGPHRTSTLIEMEAIELFNLVCALETHRKISILTVVCADYAVSSKLPNKKSLEKDIEEKIFAGKQKYIVHGSFEQFREKHKHH